ncbi:MAG: hypothetical protein WB239_07500 [Acidimicrobiia bacterium]
MYGVLVDERLTSETILCDGESRAGAVSMRRDGYLYVIRPHI